MKPGTLLFVSPAPGDSLRAARRLMQRTVVATTATLSWQKQYIDDQLVIDAYDEEVLLAAAAEYAREHPIVGVVSFDERAVIATAALQDAFGLPGNTRAAAYASRNKFIMRSRFSDAGLMTPEFALVQTQEDAIRVATEQLDFPLVLKPLFGTASEGVLRVNSLQELNDSFELVRRIAETHSKFAGGCAFKDCLLLETYLPGSEVAVDAFLVDGCLVPVGIFDKHDPLEGPTFQETIYVSPSTVSVELADCILAEVGRGTAALGLKLGPIHAELRLTERGPILLEIGARAIGGACGRAHTYRMGIDYQELALRAWLGEPIRIPWTNQTPSGVMMIPPPRRGRLQGIEGLDAARQVKGVRDAFIMSKPGDLLLGLPEQGCYVGFIFATGATQAEVVDRLKEAHRLLKLIVTPL